MANPEQQQESVSKNKVDYVKQLNDFTQKIDQITAALTDEPTENDDKAKIEGQELIQKFDDSFQEYLKNNPEQMQKLKDALGQSIQKIVDKFKKDNEGKIPDELSPLLDFAKRIGVQLKMDGKSAPEFSLNNADLQGIDSNAQDQDYFKGKDETVGINDKVEGQYSELDKTLGKINDQIDKIKAIDVSKLTEGDKGKIQQITQLLNNINNIMGKKSPDNVKILQNFISENLSGEDKTNFDKASKKGNGNFDGKFGRGTLEGLNRVLEKTGNYISTFEQGKNSENLDGVKAKEGATIKKGGEIKPEDLVDGLPNGVTVTLTDGQDIKTDNIGEITVKVDVKKGDDLKKTIDVKVKVVSENEQQVVSNPQVNEKQNPTSTEPLKFGSGESLKQYQVMQNSSDIAAKAGLNGITFYSTSPFTSQDVEGSGNDKQPKLAQSTSEIDGGEKEYYIKLSNNPDATYKVRVDKDGNLCPIAKEINNKLMDKKGESIEINALFSKIDSCKKYLQNKLPDEIKSRCEIGWDSHLQDYTLTSYGRTLTIEPMTIAGNRVSEDLSRSLAFLNLTNYIRNFGDQHGNIDPDVSGKLRIRGSKIDGKKVYIKKEEFGLKDATSEELSRFKKYNNREQWEDNWDKKKGNIGYKKIVVPDIKVQSQQQETPNVQPQQPETPKDQPQQPKTPNVQPQQPETPKDQPQQPKTPNVSAKSNEVQNKDPENVIQYGLKWDALSSNRNAKISFGIPVDKNVYSHPQRKNCYFYKDGDKIYEIESGAPYRKWEVGDGNPPKRMGHSMNVCTSGVNKFKGYLASIGEVDVNIQGGKYYLKGKKDSNRNCTLVELNYKLLSNKTSNEFFGIDDIRNRVKALALAIKSNDVRKNLGKNKYKNIYINDAGDLVCKNPAGRIEHPEERKEQVLAKKDIMNQCLINNTKSRADFVKYIRTLS